MDRLLNRVANLSLTDTRGAAVAPYVAADTNSGKRIPTVPSSQSFWALQ